MSAHFIVTLSFIISVLLLPGCGNRSQVTKEEIEANLGEYVTIYEAGVRVRVPKGYREESYAGFGNPETKCILMAKKLPAPFHEDFDKHAKSLSKKTVLSREKVRIGSHRGILLHSEKPVEGEDGPETRCDWDLVFGDEDGSMLVSGVYYKHLPPIDSATLRAAVLSAELDDSPTPKPSDRQPFTLEPSSKLKLVDASWKYYVYTEDGEVPTKSVEAPMLSAGSFPQEFKPNEDRRDFAEKLLRGERGVEQFAMQSVAETTLDGLHGYELLANGIHTKSKKPVALYYVVLFEADSFVMIAGYSGAEESKVYLPEFKAMAASLKRKKK